MNKVNESILKLREFVLYSKKIYAILGVGIMMCVYVLTANISYELGKEKGAGYSDEYIEAYGLHVAAYTSVGTDFETSNEWAKKTCDLIIGK